MPFKKNILRYFFIEILWFRLSKSALLQATTILKITALEEVEVDEEAEDELDDNAPTV